MGQDDTGGQHRGTMQALELHSYDGRPESLSLVEKPIPRPGKGQVLVRMHAAPVNPSDLAFLRGLYGRELKKLPVVAGFEGSGTVVGAGSGFLPRFMLGRRVACVANGGGDGTWAEYMTTSASFCLPLQKSTTLEQGATMLVNPLAAWALMDIAKHGHRAIVQTAAAGALGNMIRKLGRRSGITIVDVVRRPEQAELLRSQGARHVLDAGDQAFDERLGELCRKLKITLALDAVGGEMTGQLLRALHKGGRVIVYGGLSWQECRIDPSMFIFWGKRVEGFWLPTWIEDRSPLSLLRISPKIQKLLGDDLKTIVSERLPLEEAIAGIAGYERQMTQGKILLQPKRRLDG